MRLRPTIRPDPGAGAARRLIGLDLIRFAAAALVMLFHLGYWHWVTLGQAPPLFGAVGWLGWIGVEIFFTLSGMVIAQSALRHSAREFMWSRALRLYPAAIVCATITALVAFATARFAPQEIATRWLASAALWPAGPWIDAVYWTLGVEIAFYATVWALIALGKGHRLADLLALIGLWSAAYWFIRLALRLLTGDGEFALLGDRAEKLLLLHHGCYFAVGGLIWLTLQGMTSRRHLAALALGLVTCLLAILPLALDRAGDIGMPGLAVLPPLLWALSAIAMALSVSSDPWLARHIPARVAATIGLVTYPLYLLHQQVGGAWMTAIGLDPTLNAALAMAAMPLLAWGVLIWGERPLRRLIAPRPSPAPRTG